MMGGLVTDLLGAGKKCSIYAHGGFALTAAIPAIVKRGLDPKGTLGQGQPVSR